MTRVLQQRTCRLPSLVTVTQGLVDGAFVTCHLFSMFLSSFEDNGVSYENVCSQFPVHLLSR